MNILGYELSIKKKSAGTWGKLWEMAKEYRIFGETVTKPYEQVPNVYKPIKAIADNIPQAEVGFFDWESNEEIWPEELIRVFTRPNPLMSGNTFLQALVGYLALYGETFIIRQKSIGEAIGSKKLPAELWTFNPKRFTEVIGDRGIIAAWQYQGNLAYKNQIFAADEVIQIKDFNPNDDYRGIAPTKPIGNLIDIDYASMIFNKAFFKNDATPGFSLSTDKTLTPEQRKYLEEWFKKNHQGASKAFNVFIYEGGLKPITITTTHKDMEFIEQSRYTREEMLGIWRVPKAMFNITEDLNYATFVGQMKVFWQYTLMPMLRKIEDELNYRIIQPYNPKIVLRFKLENVPAFKEDFKDKVSIAKTLTEIGVPFNAINEKLNLGFEPLPWGDEPYRMINPAATMPAGNNPDETPPAKNMKNIQNLALWKVFLKKQSPLENKLESKIKRHFFEQRRKALESLSEYQSMAKMNWDEEDKLLVSKARPILKQAIDEGIAHGKLLLGNKKSIKSISDDSLNQSASSYLQFICDKIKRVNTTIQNKINEALTAGIIAGKTIAELADDLRQIYNLATARAMLISRTETTGALNAGSLLYYKENGVTGKQWITAHDEFVRDTHRDCESQGTISINNSFINGLEYPGDQSAGDASEVVNCRCSFNPIIDESILQ
jgi:HK97 family phage portal protein